MKSIIIILLFLTVKTYSQDGPSSYSNDYQIIGFDTCRTVSIALNDSFDFQNLKCVIKEVRENYCMKAIFVGFLNNETIVEKHPPQWSPGSAYIVIGTYYDKKKSFIFKQEIKGLKRKIKIK